MQVPGKIFSFKGGRGREGGHIHFARKRVFKPFFEITNMGQVTQLGTGSFVNSSTSEKTFIDYQGNIITTNPGEIVIEGASRAQNITPYSNDFENVVWTLFGDISLTGDLLSAPGGTLSRIQQTFAIPAGETWFVSCEVKSAGLGNDTFRVGGVSSQQTGTLTATSEWLIYGLSVVGDGLSTRQQFVSTSASDPMDIHIRNFQVNKGTFRVRYLDNLGDPIDYGWGANGVKYFDTEADGITKIDPTPFLRTLGDLTNNVWPSKTTDVTDYSTSTNFVNRIVSQTIFTHAAAIDVAGTQAELYHNNLVALASTNYTVVLFMKMDDDSAPRVSSSSVDTNGDVGLVLGGDFIDSSASSDHSVTKKGGIYCVMLTGTTLAVPTTAANNGIIQYIGNSDKKFEVYSIGLLNGKHLYPVYIPTTTAATSWDDDNLELATSGNHFNDRGMIVTRFNMTNYASAGSRLIGMTTVTSTDPLFISTADRVRMGDGVTQLVQGSVGSLRNVDMIGCSAWSADDSLMGPGLTNNIGVTALSMHAGGSYDGAFGTLQTNMQLFTQLNIDIKIHSIQIYHPDSTWSYADMRQWLIDNAVRVTEV